MLHHSQGSKILKMTKHIFCVAPTVEIWETSLWCLRSQLSAGLQGHACKTNLHGQFLLVQNLQKILHKRSHLFLRKLSGHCGFGCSAKGCHFKECPAVKARKARREAKLLNPCYEGTNDHTIIKPCLLASTKTAMVQSESLHR